MILLIPSTCFLKKFFRAGNENKFFKRSIYIIRDIKKGEKFSKKKY